MGTSRATNAKGQQLYSLQEGWVGDGATLGLAYTVNLRNGQPGGFVFGGVNMSSGPLAGGRRGYISSRMRSGSISKAMTGLAPVGSVMDSLNAVRLDGDSYQ